MRRRGEGGYVVVARHVVVAVEGHAHHRDDADDARCDVHQLHRRVHRGVGREGHGDHAGGDENGEDRHDGDVFERIHRYMKRGNVETTAKHAEREDEEEADAADDDCAALEDGDGGKEEGERVQEEIADDYEVGDAGTAGVEQHDERNDHTSRVTENALRLTGKDNLKLGPFLYMCIYR